MESSHHVDLSMLDEACEVTRRSLTANRKQRRHHAGVEPLFLLLALAVVVTGMAILPALLPGTVDGGRRPPDAAEISTSSALLPVFLPVGCVGGVAGLLVARGLGSELGAAWFVVALSLTAFAVILAIAFSFGAGWSDPPYRAALGTDIFRMMAVPLFLPTAAGAYFGWRLAEVS